MNIFDTIIENFIKNEFITFKNVTSNQGCSNILDQSENKY